MAAEQILSVWLEHYKNSEIVRQVETLPLRRDMETLLTFVRDGKVVGIELLNLSTRMDPAKPNTLQFETV